MNLSPLHCARMPSIARMLVAAAAVSALAGPAQAAAAPARPRRPGAQGAARAPRPLRARHARQAHGHAARGRAARRLPDRRRAARRRRTSRSATSRPHGDALGLDAGGLPPGLRLAPQDSHRRAAAPRRGAVATAASRRRTRGLRAAVTASGRLLSLGGAPAPDLVGARRPTRSCRRRRPTPPSAGHARARHAARDGAEQATTFAGGGQRLAGALPGRRTATRLGWRVLAPVCADDFARRDRRRGRRHRRAPREPRQASPRRRCSASTPATERRSTSSLPTRGCRRARRRSTGRSCTPSSTRRRRQRA